MNLNKINTERTSSKLSSQLSSEFLFNINNLNQKNGHQNNLQKLNIENLESISILNENEYHNFNSSQNNDHSKGVLKSFLTDNKLKN